MICSFYFFILINTFYGGAMTMFFTSEVTLPFETIRDVMRTYPSWNLMVNEGNEAIYRAKGAHTHMTSTVVGYRPHCGLK